MNNLNMDLIKKLISQNKIRWTRHVIMRLFQRNISQQDIKTSLSKGEIIEQYESSYPYPSVLVYGVNIEGKILHIVVGYDNEYLWIITAYYPNNNEWENDLKTRKEKK